MRIFFSAGEASGDAYAAALAKEYDRTFPNSAQFEGIGGPKLAETGAKIHASSSNWGAISIIQSLKVVPRVLKGCLKAKKQLETGQPGVFIPIDFGFANIRLAKIAKSKGWKVLYFVPPGSWRRDRQGKDLPNITDAIVTPFPWSAELLRKAGADAHFFGHPLLDMMLPKPAGETREPYIAVLPGSRFHEIHLHLPILAKALPDDKKAVFAVAPNLNRDELIQTWAKLAPNRKNDEFASSIEILQNAEAAVVCSGTATLQAAIYQTPTVLIYQVSPWMRFEARILGVDKKLKFIGLPNLLLDRLVIPELVAEFCTPEAVSAELKKLEDPQVRATMQQGFDEIKSILGEPGCLKKTVELIHQLA